uniref:MoeB n=1 Tax=Pterocladia lucida TaxID=31408 RepID=A0A6M3WW49_PTELU|nr:moeB [Pterocladia lucida]
MLNPRSKQINLIDNEYKLYSRQLIINEIGIEGQKRLKSAKILFIGAGALAAPALIYLAASGIGNIGIIDKDAVAISNLHRQIIYNHYHLNKNKVDSAKKVIHNINPLCHVTTYNEYLSDLNSINIIRHYDIIIDSCDNIATRYIIDSACYKLHKIHIYGAVEQFQGHVSVFNYKNGPRYKDLYPKYLNIQSYKCQLTGILGVLPGIIGILQSTETIKIILGLGEVLNGYLLTYNCLRLSFKKISITTYYKLKKKEGIKLNKDKNNKIISLNNLRKTTSKYSNRFLIIDVRQAHEFHLQHIQRSINIPIIQLKSQRTMAFIRYSCIRRTIVIYCSNKSRSLLASKILELNKINYHILNQEFKE